MSNTCKAPCHLFIFQLIRRFSLLLLGFFAVCQLSYAQTLYKDGSPLRVCTDSGFVPFEMQDNEGHWQGYDFDMIAAFTRSLHVPLTMVQIAFDGIIPALLSGKCDLIASGMTVTAERKKVVLFSRSTFKNSLSIGVPTSAHGRYKNLASLDQTGVMIAVKTGYTSDIYLAKTLKKAKILRFDTDSDMLLAVLQGRALALVSDTTYVELVARENPKHLQVISTNVTGEEFSVAARPRDKALIEKFNNFFSTWEKSPAYRAVYAKYFFHEPGSNENI